MELEDRIKHQFPALYITLFSVLIALVFSDLAAEAHSRMTLWPLNLSTLRTWAQIFTMGTNAMVAWIAFVHIGVSSLRVPTLSDSVVMFLLPIPLLFANSLVGRSDIWPWFYYASGYLVISLGSWLWQVRMASAEKELGHSSALRTRSDRHSCFTSAFRSTPRRGGWIATVSCRHSPNCYLPQARYPRRSFWRSCSSVIGTAPSPKHKPAVVEFRLSPVPNLQTAPRAARRPIVIG